jgi:hypothetical protein
MKNTGRVTTSFLPVSAPCLSRLVNVDQEMGFITLLSFIYSSITLAPASLAIYNFHISVVSLNSSVCILINRIAIELIWTSLELN